jgi:hypothetical protein
MVAAPRFPAGLPVAGRRNTPARAPASAICAAWSAASGVPVTAPGSDGE